MKGDGFNGAAVWGALKDGYNGEGARVLNSAIEDGLTFGGGVIGAIGKLSRLVKSGDAVATAVEEVVAVAARLCFVKGTLVHTEDGLKSIENIQIGDLVLSKDELTGETTWKSVVELFRNKNKSILRGSLWNPALNAS